MSKQRDIELAEVTRAGSSDPLRAPESDPHPTDEADPVPNVDGISRFLIGISYLFITITAPFTIWMCFIVIQEYQRGVWLRLGRLKDSKPAEPGVHFRIPWIDTIILVDMRVKTINVVPQSILSRDSVTVKVDAVIYTRTLDPGASVLNVTNEKYATEMLGQTTLRNVLGTKTLAEILSDREAITAQLREILDDATDKWGVKVERVEIRDVSLPQSMQRSMAAVAEAEREARAKVIAAESEHAASVALKNAAMELSGNPAAVQLRYLQTLNTISAEHSSTIVFPFPIELLSMFGMNRPEASAA